VVMSKKLDFGAYGISVKFEDQALREVARLACEEQTGARGLVSAVERVLLQFEKRLPSTSIKHLPVNKELIEAPERVLHEMTAGPDRSKHLTMYEKLVEEEKETIKEYVRRNQDTLSQNSKIALTPSRIDLIAEIYALGTSEVSTILDKMATFYDQVKKVEAYFYKTHDLKISLDENAIDMIILKMFASQSALGDFYKELTNDFEYGFKLMRDRTGEDTFVITKEALDSPDDFFSNLIREAYAGPEESELPFDKPQEDNGDQ